MPQAQIVPQLRSTEYWRLQLRLKVVAKDVTDDVIAIETHDDAIWRSGAIAVADNSNIAFINGFVEQYAVDRSLTMALGLLFEIHIFVPVCTLVAGRLFWQRLTFGFVQSGSK